MHCSTWDLMHTRIYINFFTYRKESEAAGFAKAQSRSSDLAKNNPASNPKENCVIS